MVALWTWRCCRRRASSLPRWVRLMPWLAPLDARELYLPSPWKSFSLSVPLNSLCTSTRAALLQNGGGVSWHDNGYPVRG